MILRATGDLGFLKFIKLCMKSFKLVVWLLRDASVKLRGLYKTNVDCTLNGAGSTVVTS